MVNKAIQRRRMMTYFIQATEELIDEIGMEKITLRKVSDRAGYNSATLYNYFENLDHLIFYAAMKNIKDYSLALNRYMAGVNNAMDIFLKVWECFCDYSYDNPEIYRAIFFPNLNKDVEDYIEEYYEFFPEELIQTHEQVSTMLLKRNINERGMTTVSNCVKEGFITYEDADKLNNMTLLIYEGMLMRIMRNRISYEDARNDTMDYIKSIVKGFLIKDYDFFY